MLAYDGQLKPLGKIQRAPLGIIGRAPTVEFSEASALVAFERIWTLLISRLNGDSWKLASQAIEEYRASRYPNLLRSMVPPR